MVDLNKILADYKNTIQTFTTTTKTKPATPDDLKKLHLNISKFNNQLESVLKNQISDLPPKLANETVSIIRAFQNLIATKSQTEKASAIVPREVSNVNAELERTHQLLKNKAEKKSKNVTAIDSDQIDA